MSEETRKSGYYWVKVTQDARWFVAKTALKDEFWIGGDLYFTTDLAVIGLYIPTPDEITAAHAPASPDPPRP